jgi:hypothetical protein
MVDSLVGGRWWVVLEVEEGGQPSTYKTTHLLPPTRLLMVTHIKRTYIICTYIRLLADKPSVSKRVEGIIKIKILV